jgi:hypothetical protein
VVERGRDRQTDAADRELPRLRGSGLRDTATRVARIAIVFAKRFTAPFIGVAASSRSPDSGDRRFTVGAEEADTGFMTRTLSSPTPLRNRASLRPGVELAALDSEEAPTAVPASAKRPVPIRSWKRLVSALLFAAVVPCLLLTFLTVVEEREAVATGFQLLTGSPELSGSYVHLSYEGEVEEVVSRGYVYARLTLAVAAAGFVLTWMPWRWGHRLGAVAGIVGLAVLGAFYLASTPTIGPTTDRGAGVVIAVILFALAFVWNAAWLRIDRDVRTAEPEWLRTVERR